MGGSWFTKKERKEIYDKAYNERMQELKRKGAIERAKQLAREDFKAKRRKKHIKSPSRDIDHMISGSDL